MITREEFGKRFADKINAYNVVDYYEGFFEDIGRQIYDAIFSTLDGAVMPPTDFWLEDIVKKIERQP